MVAIGRRSTSPSRKPAAQGKDEAAIEKGKGAAMSLDTTLVRLQHAKSRFGPAQGRLARRNARRAFLAALTAAKSAVDREYPLLKTAAPDPIDEAAASMD